MPLARRTPLVRYLDRYSSDAAVLTATVAVALVTYWPALDNGFISDDYVLLERADSWQWSLTPFGAAHETFRLSSYATFWILKQLAGYEAHWFYLFTISLHAVNGYLFFTLLEKLSVRKATAALAALLFVSQQNAQEAVMWLSAMNELYLAFFLLLFLHFWFRARYVAAAAMFLCALFSKESALILLLVLPWLEYWRSGHLKWHRGYIAVALPLGIFAVPFAATLPQHLFFSSGDYSFSLDASGVLIRTLHKLLFPWTYLLMAAALARRHPIGLRQLYHGCLWLILPLLPYIFLTYQGHLPSRQLYMASMVLTLILSDLLIRLDRGHLCALFVVAFLAGNIGYVWARKDAQFEARAAPTQRLVQFLESTPPGPMQVLDFPYNPWVAKLTARLVPDWSPEMIEAGKPEETCPQCKVIRWNPRTERYEIRRD